MPDEGDLSSEEEEAVPLKQEPNRPKYPDSIPKVVETTVSQHARQVGGGHTLHYNSLPVVSGALMWGAQQPWHESDDRVS